MNMHHFLSIQRDKMTSDNISYQYWINFYEKVNNNDVIMTSLYLFLGQCQDQLLRAKTILTDTPTLSFKELRKKRYDSSIGHCSIEQTIVMHDDHAYFSVCLEGEKSSIEKLLTRNLKNDKDSLKDFLISFGQPCGYAEFVQSL